MEAKNCSHACSDDCEFNRNGTASMSQLLSKMADKLSPSIMHLFSSSTRQAVDVTMEDVEKSVSCLKEMLGAS